MEVPKAYGYTSDWENCTLGEYHPESYMLLGKSILVSILDLFQINPYSKAVLADFTSLHNLRKTIAQKVYTEC